MGKNVIRINRVFVVPNELGLHARAAAKLTQVAAQFDAVITVCVATGDGPTANAKSVLDLLTLGAEQGYELAVTITGVDAHAAEKAITQLFAENLGD